MSFGSALASLARLGVSLGLIILILLAAKHVAPPLSAWLGTQSQALRTLPAQQETYAQAASGFAAYASGRRSEADRAAAELGRRSDSTLRARRAEIEQSLPLQRAAQLSPPGLALAAARGDSAAVLAHYRARAEYVLLGYERQQINNLLDLRAERERGVRLSIQRHAVEQQTRDADTRLLAANRRIAQLESRFLARARDEICARNQLNIGCNNYRALVAARAAAQSADRDLKLARAQLAVIDAAEQQLNTTSLAVVSAAAILEQEQAALTGELARLTQARKANWLITAWRAVASVLPAALVVLALAMLAPVGVKALLFFVVAPLAARRPPIRLLPTDRGEVTTAASSAVSQKLYLEPGQELLVLPEALQSTPHHAAKRTRWLLSWRIPLSSLASGLIGLTQIRVARPDTVLVSATGGAEAEIALIWLEAGSALVLRPRALRGILQDAAAPMRITRRWRFGLGAWLTLQFRYLIFHGPCTFIVEGARGVRLEPAGTGRGINQAATIGFSAGVAYGVSRSETFVAYVRGRQALFNDSFQSAHGAHLHEEMLMLSRRGHIVSRSLQGLGDAALKVVGL